MSEEPQTIETPIEATPDTGSEPDLTEELAKWKAMARKHEGQAKSNADAAKRLAEIEEAQKTAEQKAADKAAEADAKAAKAEQELMRYRVAVRKGLPETLAKRLTGGTEEELEADADELLSLTKRDEPVEGDKPESRPKERLKSGSTPPEDGPSQLSREDLKTMTPDEIVKAKAEGRLTKIMGGK